MVYHGHVQRAPCFWGIRGAGKCSWCRNSDCVCLPLVACIYFWFLFPNATLAGLFFSPHDDFCLHISWVQQDFLFHHSLSTDSHVFSKVSHWLSLGWVSAARAFNLLPALLVTFLWSLVPPRAVSFLCQIPKLLTCSPCRYLQPSVFTLCSCFLSQMPVFVLIPVG